MTALRLIVFDVDGTLVDSQAHIHAAMAAAFERAGRAAPARADVRGVIGLSLPQAVARLAGEAAPDETAQLVADYKQAYADLRATLGEDASPLYPGIAALLADLAARDGVALGIATGKSRRGLSLLLEMHGLSQLFATTQVADDHPSKPHPAMLRAALDAAGCGASEAVMIGDTVYDLAMAKAAGVPALGVAWGYHEAAALMAEAPLALAADVPALCRQLDRLLHPSGAVVTP